MKYTKITRISSDSSRKRLDQYVPKAASSSSSSSGVVTGTYPTAPLTAALIAGVCTKSSGISLVRKIYRTMVR
ncbi:hypothetical protein VYU27_009544 [Nannochloropsis oceanica]